MTHPLNTLIRLSSQLAEIGYSIAERNRGSQYACAVSMLHGAHLSIEKPWSEQPSSSKRINLLRKARGLVDHDRCLNYHYIKGSELFPKI